MNSEQITAFLQEHWYIASVLIATGTGSATPLVRGMPTATAEDTGRWFSSCWASS